MGCGVSGPTQSERVLRALRTHPRGITQLDFDGPRTVDGGPPVRRLASRIADLRAAGHRIEVRGRRHKMAVYVLVGTAVAASPRPPTSLEDTKPGPPALFDGHVGKQPPRGPYDPDPEPAL